MVYDYENEAVVYRRYCGSEMECEPGFDEDITNETCVVYGPNITLSDLNITLAGTNITLDDLNITLPGAEFEGVSS